MQEQRASGINHIKWQETELIKCSFSKIYPVFPASYKDQVLWGVANVASSTAHVHITRWSRYHATSWGQTVFSVTFEPLSERAFRKRALFPARTCTLKGHSPLLQEPTGETRPACQTAAWLDAWRQPALQPLYGSSPREERRLQVDGVPVSSAKVHFLFSLQAACY